MNQGRKIEVNVVAVIVYNSIFIIKEEAKISAAPLLWDISYIICALA
jgi:uncharacterized protein Veg